MAKNQTRKTDFSVIANLINYYAKFLISKILDYGIEKLKLNFLKKPKVAQLEKKDYCSPQK